jgi:hypothetical protein
MFIAEGLTRVSGETAYPCHTAPPASPADPLEQGRYIRRGSGKDDPIDIADIDSHLQGSGGKAQSGGPGQHSTLDGLPSGSRQTPVMKKYGISKGRPPPEHGKEPLCIRAALHKDERLSNVA